MENEKEKNIFKVPQISIGPRPGTNKTVKCVDSSSDDSPTNVADTKDVVEEKTEPKIITKKIASKVPIPYEEPSWGGKPGDKYFLEVCAAGFYLLICAYNCNLNCKIFYFSRN